MPSAFASGNMSNLDIVVYNTYNNYFYGDSADFTFTGGPSSDNICAQVMDVHLQVSGLGFTEEFILELVVHYEKGLVFRAPAVVMRVGHGRVKIAACGV